MRKHVSLMIVSTSLEINYDNTYHLVSFRNVNMCLLEVAPCLTNAEAGISIQREEWGGGSNKFEKQNK